MRLAPHPAFAPRHGYTLVELLLAVVLVLALLSAVVFNFGSVNRNAQLDEGATQVEALFRFARAHAASTGKQVRILFPEAESGDNAELLAAEAPGATVRVTCERDPIGAPGVFTDVPEAANFVASISDLVSIQQVQAGESGADNFAEVAPLPGEAAATDLAAEPSRSPFSTVTFYPDGTGDTVELLVTSRSEDDARRFTVKVTGLTGAIRRQLLADPATETAPPASATEAAAEVAR
jgi:prepilin-type N-terminal cleavage/methylation domain-containing protein